MCTIIENTVLKRDFKAILMKFLVLNKTRVSSPRYKYIYKLHFRFRLNLFSLIYNRSYCTGYCEHTESNKTAIEECSWNSLCKPIKRVTKAIRESEAAA